MPGSLTDMVPVVAVSLIHADVCLSVAMAIIDGGFN